MERVTTDQREEEMGSKNDHMPLMWLCRVTWLSEV